MKEEYKISRDQLKNLLFWAMCGFSSSNGGTGEKYISKVIASYAKLIKMKTSELPPLGIKSRAELTGRTKNALVKELKVVFPKYKFY